MNTTDLPNPLQVNFGDGQIAVAMFDDKDRAGIVLWQADKKHTVGEYGQPLPNPHKALKGEIYLSFTNTASFEVVLGFMYRAYAVLAEREEQERQKTFLAEAQVRTLENEQ